MDEQRVIGSARVLRGNALELPLADDSVDLVVTSPPYFGLRSYQDGGEHYGGQIGAEATPAEFVAALVAATAEMVRVIKPSGSIFVNLGDKYAGSKSLIGLPWRYALACIDDLGLILRAEIIWSKPNGLPESVKDRVRRSHETWFHFVKSHRYFTGVDEIRESVSIRPGMVTWPDRVVGKGRSYSPDNRHNAGGAGMMPHPLGKLPGSVWDIATQPLKVPAELGIDHFAAFPMEWPRRIIRGWSPRGVCVECGAGRRPVVDVDRTGVDYGLSTIRATERVDATAGAVSGGTQRSTLGHQTSRTITGEACDCPEPTAPTTPGVVLDPFGGTGTTATVAKALGRQGITVDMSADYCHLAEWRTNDPKELEKARSGVGRHKREHKPKSLEVKEMDLEPDLFGESHGNKL